MYLTTFAAQALGQHVLRNAAITFPTDWEIALHTADPTETGSTAAEVSTADWSNYVRQTLARDAVDWAAGSAQGLGFRIPNAVDVAYGTVVLVNPVTVTHITIRDASDNGWWHGALASPAVVQDDQPFTISTGDLGITWRYLES